MMKELSYIGYDETQEDLLVRLGRRVRELRCQQSMSPDELGDNIGHTVGFVLRLESGRVRVSFKTLGRCARALNYEITDLLKI